VPRFNNEGLDHVAIAVADPQRSRRFYEEVLGLEFVRHLEGGPMIMTANGNGLAIFDRGMHPSPTPDHTEPPAVRILHIAFRLDRAGFDEARSALAAEGLEPRFEDHINSHSLYFRDPDGHQIELTTYEVESSE
jgi:catechol 2,3-dioxygenase-like lactoylglutathione lyase family enzyme